MNEPNIAQKGPFLIDLEPGTYWWCACGRSNTQPFCDGSHEVTEFTPVEFEITEAESVYLCGCKHTDDEPYCDGTHKKL